MQKVVRFIGSYACGGDSVLHRETDERPRSRSEPVYTLLRRALQRVCVCVAPKSKIAPSRETIFATAVGVRERQLYVYIYIYIIYMYTR